ncbi:MAG: hypothetical protein AAFV07_18425, partial [Bacteroidota bacterium]
MLPYVKEWRPARMFLGEDMIPASYMEFPHPTMEGARVRALFRGEQVVKIDVEFSLDGEAQVQQIREQLGEPEAKLDYYFDVLPMREKTHVYASQGMALFWGMSDSSLYHISYFAPMTATEYHKSLHPVESPRELEAPTLLQ